MRQGSGLGSGYQGGQPEYCVFYGVSESGNAGFYRYDLTDKTIQRYFEQSAEGNTQTLELQDVTERYNNLVDDYNIVRVLLAAVGVVAVVLLILLILSRKGRGRKNEEEYDAYAQLDEKPERKEKKAKKEFRKNGRKLSQEERYMMGEEDDYEENYEPEQETGEEEPEDDEMEIQGCRGIHSGSCAGRRRTVRPGKETAGCEPCRRFRADQRKRKRGSEGRKRVRG